MGTIIIILICFLVVLTAKVLLSKKDIDEQWGYVTIIIFILLAIFILIPLFIGTKN